MCLARRDFEPFDAIGQLGTFYHPSYPEMAQDAMIFVVCIELSGHGTGLVKCFRAWKSIQTVR